MASNFVFDSTKQICMSSRYRKFIIQKYALLLPAIFLYSTISAQSLSNPSIVVELTRPVGDMKPIWAWFGHDEPNYTYMKDGKKLLTELAALSPVPVHLRTHNLL